MERARLPHGLTRGQPNPDRAILTPVQQGSRVKKCALSAMAALFVAQTVWGAGDPDYSRRFAAARTQYFADLEGDHEAGTQARASFEALSKEHPGDPAVDAYRGSLELLQAAHTWAIWDKRRLANEGLSTMDEAVDRAPDDLEARFIRAASSWHLPFFYKRRDLAESDFGFIAPRAEDAVKKGTLPPELAAAALDYYGQVLIDRSDNHGAKLAFEAAVRVDSTSPGGRDAMKRLHSD